MRRILASVADEWEPVVHLAADIYGQLDGRVDRAAEEATRRACKRLAKQGLVEIGYTYANGHVYGEPPGKGHRQTFLLVRRKF